MKTELLDQDSINQLCRDYSKEITEGYRHDALQKKLSDALDVECIHLQRLWRRALTVATRGTFINTDRARVWMSINHSVRPVTVTPIASVSICIVQGCELNLSFVATTENIKAETAKFKKVLAVYLNR